VSLKQHNHSTGIQKWGIMVLLFFVFIQSGQSRDKAIADTFDITSHTLRFPDNLKPWRFRIGAGFLVVQPPMDLVETSLQAPMANVNMSLGMPWKFSFIGDITTIVVSNQLSFGIRVGTRLKNFALNAGWDFAWVYGQFRPEGFDNVTKAWLYYPNFSLGYKLKKIAFSLKAEVVFISSIQQLIGTTAATGIVISDYANNFNGLTCALYIEQRLWKNNVLIIGLKDNYVKYYWPTWMLFSTFNRFYQIPEFSLMLIL
jgi:hypothetical protein